jgi:hypothetical protein
MQKLAVLVVAIFIVPISTFGIELSSEVRELLHSAVDTGEYRVTVVEKETEKGTQAIVILGETHLKTKKASLIGKKILDHFNLFGLEGMDFSLLKPNHCSDYLSLVYPIGALFYGGTEASERTTTHDVILPYEMSDPEKLMTYFLLLSDLRPSVDPNQLYAALKLQFEHNPKFRETWFSNGIGEELLESVDQLPELLSIARQRIFGDAPREIVMLEQFDPLPEGIKKWNDSIGRSAQAIKGCSALLGTAALAYLGGKYVPQRVHTCLNVAALASVPGVIAYMGGYFNLFLPEKYQMPCSLLTGLQSADDERNKTMTLRMHTALEMRPETESMLVIVGLNHIPGIVKLLTETLGYREVSF